MELYCKGTSSVQKDVRGKIKYGDIIISDGLILDVSIPKPLADLEDIPLDAEIGSEIREKFLFEYFKDLPIVDVNDLNIFDGSCR